MAIAVAGCGGGGAGSNGTTGATNPASVTKFAATAWQALKPQIDPASITVDMTAVSGVVKPVVTFKVTDDLGNPVIGLGGQIGVLPTALPTNYNLQFTLAKLIPANATTGEPSKWVSYLVTKPTVAASAITGWVGTYPTSDTNGALVDNNDGTYKYTFLRDIAAVQAQVTALTDSGANVKADLDPANLAYDATATTRLGIIITGSQPGTGTNTPTKVQVVNTVPLLSTFNIGYDFVPAGGSPTVTRDIVVKASCATCHDNRAIGHISTSNGGANGIPAGNYVGRNDPRLCVTCHTDQTKYGFANLAAADANGNYTGAYYRTVDGQAAFTYPRMIHQFHMGDKLTKTGYNLNGHCNDPRDTSGVSLSTKATANSAACFNTVGLPQSQQNCSTCHAGATTATGNTNKTTDGDNWKNKPSIIACGSCHDGINFADGTGFTLADIRLGNTTPTGHLAGIGATANASCAGCHTAAGINPSVATSEIALVHRTTNATPNNPTTVAGVANFVYAIKSVTVNSSGQPVISFQIKKDGVVQTLANLNVPSLVTNAVTGAQVISPAYEPITGFASGPSLYVAYAVPQDGIAAPADFNAYQSVSLANLLVATGSPKQGTLADDTANAGYLLATLTGDLVGQAKTSGCSAATAPATTTCGVATAVLANPIVIPTTAKMVTGAIIGSFTQKGLTAYPYTPADVSVNNVASATGVTPVVAKGTVSASGGLVRPAVLKKLVATGYTARRVVTDPAKCNSCHEQLGTDPNFHGGARNDPTACAICHNNTRTSNGWVANTSTFIHGIHGASKRTVPYMWAAVAADDNYSQIGYPGLLKDCNQCHLPSTVNFGATGGTSVATNLLWPTSATGKFDASTANTTAFRNSPYVVTDNATNYGNGFSYTPAGSTVSAYTPSSGTAVAAHVAGAGGETVAADPATLVNSPMASACFSCHDTSLAKAHMTQNGGAIYVARSSVSSGGALVNNETCLTCHAAGKVADAAAIHGAK